MTIRHFHFSFFDFLTLGIFTTWGTKNFLKIIIITTIIMSGLRALQESKGGRDESKALRDEGRERGG